MTAKKETFQYRIHPQFRLNMGEIVVDNFAGGGGASTGIEAAIGRPVDIAINHDPDAVAMHEVNHPCTKHFCESVWDVDPVEACAGRPVGLAWFSPDCKHFSKARGGTPVKKQIRGLAWVVLKWAGKVRPRIIMLENVEEFTTWGPVKKDESGQEYPCPKRKGKTFQAFKKALRKLGYQVEHRELVACDYGAPTSRKRFFLVARCDGTPISWPEPTHGDPKSAEVKSGQLLPWRTAAECIDWTLPCPSIFLTKEEAKKHRVRRPLVDATLRRIAKGVMRYVVNAADPFIVPLTHQGTRKNHKIKEPFRTITGAHRDELALVSPHLIGIDHRGSGDSAVWGPGTPVTTVTSEARHALVCSFFAKHYTGACGSSALAPLGTVTSIDHHSVVAANLVRQFGKSVGSSCESPVGTITAGGAGKTGLISSCLVKLRGTCRDGQKVDAPLHTISAGGLHFGEVRAFLLKYYGCDQNPNLREPLHTITTKDRFGIVTVKGEDFYIADIGMRMFSPRELFRAHGFPEDYIIDRDARGNKISGTEQVNRVGNSVPPAFSEAMVLSNYVTPSAISRAA